MAPRDPDKVGPKYHKNGFYKGMSRRERLSSNGVAPNPGVAAAPPSVALEWATWPTTCSKAREGRSGDIVRLFRLFCLLSRELL